jgi:uroporphyrinogen-III decarboxylase
LAKSELERRDVALVGIAAGPCTIAYQLRDMKLFTDLFRYPKCAAQLFAYAGQVSAVSARIYAEIIGCDIVAINDTRPPCCSQPISGSTLCPICSPRGR